MHSDRYKDGVTGGLLPSSKRTKRCTFYHLGNTPLRTTQACIQQVQQHFWLFSHHGLHKLTRDSVRSWCPLARQCRRWHSELSYGEQKDINHSNLVPLLFGAPWKESTDNTLDKRRLHQTLRLCTLEPLHRNTVAKAPNISVDVSNNIVPATGFALLNGYLEAFLQLYNAKHRQQCHSALGHAKTFSTGNGILYAGL